MAASSSTPAPLDQGRQLGKKVGRLFAGDEGGKVPGVGADIADGAANAGLLGIGTPHGALGAGVLDRRAASQS